MDAEQALDAAFHFGGDGCLFQLVAEGQLDPCQKLLALLTASFDGVVHLAVSEGIEIAESQVLEFAANLAHAEPVGDGAVNLKRLFCNLLLAIGGKMFESAHVVQTVRKLNQDDANVIDHGQHHLAKVLGLLLLASGEVDLADLGHSFDDVGHLLAKLFADVDNGDRSVFDRVVQQTGGNGHRIHLHLRQNLRDSEGMNQIGFAGGAGLAGMMFLGELVGFAHQFQIVAGPVGAKSAQQFPELGHREGGGRDLFAQRRHAGL